VLQSTSWPDPRSLLDERVRGELEGDDGFRALMAFLLRSGPCAVPSRRRAAGISRRSEASFRRHFPAVFRVQWRAFVTGWRLECSQSRLEDPYTSLTEVARACGFRSEQGFSRSYLARYGKRPRIRRLGSD